MSIFHEVHDKSSFDSPREVRQLEKNLAGLIEQGIISEIPVEIPISPLGYEEHWYEDKQTGEVYRYVPPEFPARGIWGKVGPDAPPST